MLAVMYDKSTGVIRSLMRGSEETLAVNGDHIEVTEYRTDYNTHYKVVDGKVVPKSDEEMATVFFPPASKFGLDLSPDARGTVEVPAPPAPSSDYVAPDTSATGVWTNTPETVAPVEATPAETPAATETDAPAPDAPAA